MTVRIYQMTVRIYQMTVRIYQITVRIYQMTWCHILEECLIKVKIMRASDQNCVSRDGSSHERGSAVGCNVATEVQLLILRQRYSC